MTKKNQTLKIFVLGLVLLLGMGLIIAQGNGVKYQQTEKFTQQELIQHQNQFENKYNFTCKGECTYGENNQSQVTLQVREQKRFLFWKVNAEENYTLNEEGKITQAKYNFWSRILNWNRLKVI